MYKGENDYDDTFDDFSGQTFELMNWYLFMYHILFRTLSLYIQVIKATGMKPQASNIDISLHIFTSASCNYLAVTNTMQDIEHLSRIVVFAIALLSTRIMSDFHFFFCQPTAPSHSGPPLWLSE